MQTLSKRIKKLQPYLLFCALSLGVGLLAALLTRKNMSLYDEVIMPPAAPPSWLFPIAWGILYILMGIGAARVYRARENDPPAAKDAFAFFGMNLFVNFAWSVIFFNYRAFWFSFVWLLLLLAIILRMTFAFRRVDRIAAYLQIPYILWVIFAGYLNCGIAVLN